MTEGNSTLSEVVLLHRLHHSCPTHLLNGRAAARARPPHSSPGCIIEDGH